MIMNTGQAGCAAPPHGARPAGRPGPGLLGAAALSVYAFGLGAAMVSATHLVALPGAAALAALLGVWAAGGVGLLLACRAARVPRAFAALAALVQVCLLARGYAFLDVHPVLQPDSYGYLSLSTWRAPTVPLIYHALGGGMRAILLAQFALGGAAWTLLAAGLYALAAGDGEPAAQHERRGRLAGATPTLAALPALAFGASGMVLGWDAVVQSESLTLTLGAALAGVTLAIGAAARADRVGAERATERATERGAARGLDARLWLAIGLVWLPLLAAFCGARDTNAYLIPVSLPFLALFLARRRARLVPAVLVLVLAAGLFVWSGHEADRQQRWVGPLADVIFRRVLPDAEATAYFVARGMPLDADVRAFSGRFLYEDVVGYRRMTAFRAWLSAQGKATYMSYLLAHLPEVNREAIVALPASFDAAALETLAPGRAPYDALGMPLREPAGWLTSGLAAPIGRPWALLGAGAAIALLALLALVGPRRTRSLALLNAWLFAAFYSQYFLAYHGDDSEVARHALVAHALFRAWLVSSFACAWALAARARATWPALARLRSE